MIKVEGIEKTSQDFYSYVVIEGWNEKRLASTPGDADHSTPR